MTDQKTCPACVIRVVNPGMPFEWRDPSCTGRAGCVRAAVGADPMENGWEPGNDIKLYRSRIKELMAEVDRLTGERDVALAQARYIAKALEAAANSRDEALAREAVLREALATAAKYVEAHAKYVEAHAPEYWVTPPEVQQVRAALTNTATVAAARDAGLKEEE